MRNMLYLIKRESENSIQTKMYDIDSNEEEETVNDEDNVNINEDCKKQETMEIELVKEKTLKRPQGHDVYLII